MHPSIDHLTRFCLELLGLTATMIGVVVLAVHYYFGGFAAPEARSSLVFCVLVLLGSALPLQIYAVARIMHLRTQNRRLFEFATRDGLTQVLNRTAFKKSAELAIARMGGLRSGDMPACTLLIIDTDHFKRINDRLGHHTGDEALTAIADTLRRSVRQNDLVGRLGGEEFAILLRNAGYEEGRIVAERLRLAIHQLEVGPANRRVRLSVSLGGIAFRNPVAFNALYKLADANLYRAKATGRNRSTLTRLGTLDETRTALAGASERERGDEPRRLEAV